MTIEQNLKFYLSAIKMIEHNKKIFLSKDLPADIVPSSKFHTTSERNYVESSCELEQYKSCVAELMFSKTISIYCREEHMDGLKLCHAEEDIIWNESFLRE